MDETVYDQIIGQNISGLTKIGLILGLLIISILVIMGWLIKFPEVISVPVFVTTEPEPVYILSSTPGVIKPIKGNYTFIIEVNILHTLNLVQASRI